MAARISARDLITELQPPSIAPPKRSWEQEARSNPQNRNHSLSVPVRPSIFPSSPSPSLPTVSEIALPPAVPPQTFPPPSDRPSRRLERKYTLADLMAKARRMCGSGTEIQKHLAEADRHIHRGMNATAIPELEAALMLVGEEPQLQCLLWRLLGNAHLSLSHFKKASVCHMHQLAFCRELSDFEGMTRAECNLGIAYMKLGLLKLAGRCFVQYLENSKILQDDMGIAYASSNLGVLAKLMGIQDYLRVEDGRRITEEEKKKVMERFKDHIRKAISYFEQHLEIVERNSDLEKQSRAYGNLSSCYEMLHQHVQAVFCHNKRLDIVRSTGSRNAEACTLCNLGNCLRATGKLEEAMECYSLGLELCQTTNNRAVETVVLLNLGTTCELLGQADHAIEWHTLYLSMNVQANDLPGQARALGILADLYWQTNQIIKAHEYYKKLMDVFQQLGDREAHAKATHYMIRTKELVERQKRLMKLHRKAKGKGRQPPQRGKKPLKGRGAYSHPKPVQGSLESLLIADSQMVKGKYRQKKSKKVDHHANRGSWSPGLKRWYNVKSKSPGVATWSLQSPLVLENRHAFQDVLQLGNQRNLYQTTGIAEQLDRQEGDIDDVLRGARSSFYTLGDFMGPTFVHVHSPTDDDSTTEYEDVEDSSPFRTRDEAPQFFGSARHTQDLKQVGHSLLSMAASDPGGQGAEEEWVRWLQVHRVGPKSVKKRASPPPPAAKKKTHGFSLFGEDRKRARKKAGQGMAFANPATQRESRLI